MESTPPFDRDAFFSSSVVAEEYVTKYLSSISMGMESYNKSAFGNMSWYYPRGEKTHKSNLLFRRHNVVITMASHSGANIEALAKQLEHDFLEKTDYITFMN